MTVILKVEFASGRLLPMASLTGLVTKGPQHHLALVQSMTTLLAAQVCSMHFYTLLIGYASLNKSLYGMTYYSMQMVYSSNDPNS